jgi:YVTN family beta-propeller protein
MQAPKPGNREASSMTIVRHATAMGLLILVTVSLSAAPSQASQQPARGQARSSPDRIKVTATIDVGHSPYGVAADPDTNAIYVTGANAITEISGLTNTVVASIPVGIDPIAIATDPKADTIYVANFESASVSVINGHTNRVTATIPVPALPAGIAADPQTGKIYLS